MLKYALICGRIEQYVDGSVKETVSRYDGKTPMLEWTDSFGHKCIGVPESFLPGTLEELTEIVRKGAIALQSKISKAQARFPLATPTENIIIQLLVEDGYDPEEITTRLVKKVTEGCIQYMDCCSTLQDAYMDYMH